MRRKLGERRARQRTCARPLARRLLRLKPKTFHPILNDGDTDGSVAIEAAQVRQFVEFFVYARDKPNRQADSLLFVGQLLEPRDVAGHTGRRLRSRRRNGGDVAASC